MTGKQYRSGDSGSKREARLVRMEPNVSNALDDASTQLGVSVNYLANAAIASFTNQVISGEISGVDDIQKAIDKLGGQTTSEE